jgi:hypothetical protein
MYDGALPVLRREDYAADDWGYQEVSCLRQDVE